MSFVGAMKMDKVRFTVDAILHQVELLSKEGTEFPQIRLTIDAWNNSVKVHASSGLKYVGNMPITVSTVLNGIVKMQEECPPPRMGNVKRS